LLKLQDSDGGFRFAPIGVPHVSGIRFFCDLKSTEKNCRVLYALQNLYAATGEAKYNTAAANLKNWLKWMYNKDKHLYHTSAQFDGSTWVRSSLDPASEYVATDVTALAPIEWMAVDSYFGVTQAERDNEIAAMFEAIIIRTALRNSSGMPLFYKFSESQTGEYG